MILPSYSQPLFFSHPFVYKVLPYLKNPVQYWFFSWLGRSKLGFHLDSSDHSIAYFINSSKISWWSFMIFMFELANSYWILNLKNLQLLSETMIITLPFWLMMPVVICKTSLCTKFLPPKIQERASFIFCSFVIMKTFDQFALSIQNFNASYFAAPSL